MKDQPTSSACALCASELSQHSIIDGVNRFCCTGCHTVFNILAVKNQLDGYASHPLFLQALRSGIISNPALLEHIQRQQAEIRDGEREKLHLEIGEMWCPSCAEIIRLMLLREKGVINCVIDYSTDLAGIEFSPRYISKDKIIQVISQLGYIPHSLDNTERKAVSKDLYLRFIVAAFCSLNSMMFAYPLYATYFNYDGEGYGSLFAWLSLFTSLPVVTYSAWPIWRRFLGSLKTGLFGMETLVAIGVGSAFALSLFELLNDGDKVYFDSMTVIIVFVLLGKIIESKAKFSAKEALFRLSRSTPRRGRKLLPDGSLQFVLVKEIAKGDQLAAYPGEKIVLDGIVTEGNGSCDESLMTGESVPLVKKEGSGVLGGTILSQGHLTYRVTSSPEETALHKIIQMVEHDIGHKSVYVRAADRIVRWFVPSVIALAGLTFALYILISGMNTPGVYEAAFLRALAVLLISCPCAIGIAAPAAESYLLNGLAALGAIVRNRGCLQYLGRETLLVFDKTGTITEGRFKVCGGLDNFNEHHRRILYSLASQSTHPIACAVATSLFDTEKCSVIDMQEVIGHGLKGNVDRIQYYFGSARFMKQQGIELAVEFSDAIDGVFTSVYFANGERILAHLQLGDEIRVEALNLVDQLQPAQSILLSGDSKEPVEKVAKRCGFNTWHAEFTPLEKREWITSSIAAGNIVCMVGDGINDAPALTAAHVGISVVSASDMSIQVSDILLTTDRLSVLVKIRELAQRGRKIVKQNLFWAFFYNIIGIFLAMFGLLSPIFAAIAMSISSLTVLFNARRLS